MLRGRFVDTNGEPIDGAVVTRLVVRVQVLLGDEQRHALPHLVEEVGDDDRVLPVPDPDTDDAYSGLPADFEKQVADAREQTKKSCKSVVTNAQLAERVDTSDEWIVQRVGIHERHIAAEGEMTSDLAVAAAVAASARRHPSGG